MIDAVIIIDFLTIAIIVSISALYIRKQSRIIEQQQETIQKLINREPVTYKELNVEPPKRSTERYAAWGSQTFDIEDVESP